MKVQSKTAGPFRTLFVFVFVCALLGILVPAAQAQVPGCENCPPAGPIAESFTGAQTQLGHLTRDGNASTCAGKAFPGVDDPGTTLNYENYAYRNYSSVATCVTVNFNPGGVIRGGIPCGTNAQVAAYLGSYDSANLGTNFLGDSGSSAASSFSFQVPPNSDFSVVVSNSAAADTCGFTLEVAGLQCQSDTSVCDLSNVGIPTLGMPGILTLIALLAISAAFLLRRRTV